MTRLRWTLAALLTLGGTAAADTARPSAADTATEAIAVQGSHRGVAQDYIVMPRGGELSAQMRFLTAGRIYGEDKLEFTDLALFGISGRWSLFSRLELSGNVDLLPKQPSTTDEKVWQSVGFGVRSPLGRNIAVAISGGGGHLMNHGGMWTRESLTLEWKKPIDDELLAFDVQAGVNGLGLSAKETTDSTAFITEFAVSTTALFHEPKGHWGAWLGIAYAVPVQASGRDPTTEMEIDPQPRLNFHMGTVLALVPKWDLFVDFAVIDRGDLADPATRLPILDGGFDQRQIVFGVTRHFESKAKRSYDDDGGSDGIRVGSL
jgi:hypothetical protein